ncbi:MAG: AMP-binding protein, partial [Acidobacteriota bacterium]
MSFDNVEDVLALTPTQQGVLVHCLEQPDSDVYLSQLVATLGAALDLDLFRVAWDELVSRHAALRTAFLWDGLDEPLQIVRETVEVEWTILDAPTDPPIDPLADDDAAWAERLAADRARGFALDAAPLVRMTLAPRADGRWRWAWTFHHLILDGWSARHLLDELRSIVAARRNGEAPTLSAPFAWREMVAWHAARDPSAGEAFWRDELDGFDRPTRLDLPVSRGGGSGRVRRVLPPTFGDTIARVARAHGLTVATLVQGAWAIVVSRWAREDDVVFGITQAVRPPELAGVEQGVGLFIATVPLRARLDPAAPVADWLRELQRRQVAARRWASTPLATIRRCAELPAGESLLDHLLVIESHPGGEDVGPPELACADLDILERSHYPLAVLVLPGETPELLAIHDRRRIGERTAARLLDHLAAMLDQIVEAPEAPMRDLALGDAAARRQVLGEWSGSASERPPDERIDHVIARIARDHGERTALIHDGERTSYRALLGRADRLAVSLRERGVGADVPVALRVERSTELIVGLLAILRAGGAYVPIDPAYPAAHHRRVLEDVTPPVVVARGPCPDALSSWADAWLDLDALDLDSLDEPSTAPGGDLSTETRPEHLAYILYTSGSTGEPKGVMVEHRQLVRSTAARSRVYPEPLGRFLLLSSIAFDSSVAGLFWTLTTGGTLVLPSDDAIHEPDRLRALIATESVTHTLALPALYRVLLDAGPAEPLASLTVVVVAGEACPPDLVAHHRRLLPSARLVNEYGPTEGTVWATAHELGPADVDGPVPIGRPIPNARVAVLDHHDQPAPVGVAGELVIAGDGV